MPSADVRDRCLAKARDLRLARWREQRPMVPEHLRASGDASALDAGTWQEPAGLVEVAPPDMAAIWASVPGAAPLAPALEAPAPRDTAIDWDTWKELFKQTAGGDAIPADDLLPDLAPPSDDGPGAGLTPPAEA